jgi:hypothetical protein
VGKRLMGNRIVSESGAVVFLRFLATRHRLPIGLPFQKVRQLPR